MKKLVTTVAVLACAASFVSAQVTSVNIVGYATISAPQGQLVLCSLNFDTGGQTLDELIGDQLADFSVINVWDKDSNTYINSTKTRAGWGPNAVMNLGDAFWITSSGAGTTEVIVSGDVLLDATNTVAMTTLDATGYYYPVETLFVDTDLSMQAPEFSVLNIWNGAGYDNYTKTRAGWGADGVSLSPTVGFWFTPAADFTWEEERPFTP